MPETLISQCLGAIPLPALVIDRTERVIAANSGATALLGAGIVGRHFATALRQPPVTEAIETTLADGVARKARQLSSEGVMDATYEVYCRAMDDSDQPKAVLVSFQDITRLEQANRMRQDFVANVSHELRTPLTAIMGFIETLRGPARGDEAAYDRFLTIMQGEATRMNRLVGDLLSLSRVEDQARVRPNAEVDLNALLSNALGSLMPLAEDAGVHVDLSLPQTPVMLVCDPDQIQQVVVNLVENAIKYGGSGGEVAVALSQCDRDPVLRTGAVRLTVRDQGPGIEAMHLPRLTERFYRVDSHRSRTLGGTGLGLAIAKHIVNRHRGRLRVESEPGQGATFTVILPHEIQGPVPGA